MLNDIDVESSAHVQLSPTYKSQAVIQLTNACFLADNKGRAFK